MASKPDTSKLAIVKTFFLVGDKNLNAKIMPKLSPLGVQPKKLVEEVNKVAKEWEGIRIYIEFHVQNREAKIKLVIGTSAHIVKAMNGAKYRDRKKEKLPNRSGNLPFSKILSIAKLIHEEGRSLSKDLSGTVKQVLGTCLTMGCTVD